MHHFEAEGEVVVDNLSCYEPCNCCLLYPIASEALGQRGACKAVISIGCLDNVESLAGSKPGERLNCGYKNV